MFDTETDYAEGADPTRSIHIRLQRAEGCLKLA